MHPRFNRLTLSLALSLVVLATAAGCGGDDGDGPMFSDDHPRIYLPRERDRLAAKVAAGDPAWVRFKSIVDIQVEGGDIWGFGAWNGALMGQLTGDPKYCAKSVAVRRGAGRRGRVAIAAGQRPEVALDSYLEIGEMIGDLALVYDWCHSTLSAAQRTRWIAYANQAVWNVWNPTEAKWGGTTQPVEWLVGQQPVEQLLLLVPARDDAARPRDHAARTPQAAGWLDDSSATTRSLGQLVPTFAGDLAGGGSREGTGYGVAMRNLFELYDLWKATTGEKLATKTGHTRASMLAFMHQIDADARPHRADRRPRRATRRRAFFDYHRDYLQKLITCSRTTARRAREEAARQLERARRWAAVHGRRTTSSTTSAVAPTPLDGLGNALLRAGHRPALRALGLGRPHATWVNLIAGPYTESHAHQDQGSLMIYKGGWLAYDAVVDSNSGLTQETAAHSLVRIDSGGTTVGMREGTTSEIVAVARGDGYIHTAGDLTAASTAPTSDAVAARDGLRRARQRRDLRPRRLRRRGSRPGRSCRRCSRPSAATRPRSPPAAIA